MATLEKRVQVLFSAEQYARLEAEAKIERMSVGAYIRDAVDKRVDRRRADVETAIQGLWAWADEHPVSAPTPEEWDAMKDEMWDRPVRDENADGPPSRNEQGSLREAS
jgi:hypothetical protein